MKRILFTRMSSLGDIIHTFPAATDVRAAYRSTVEEVIAEWRDVLAATGVSYELVVTDQSFGVPLRRAFAARQRLP